MAMSYYGCQNPCILRMQPSICMHFDWTTVIMHNYGEPAKIKNTGRRTRDSPFFELNLFVAFVKTIQQMNLTRIQ